MDWSNIVRFCFTYAMMGGAWLEDSAGRQNWFSYETIVDRLGAGWFERQRRATGDFTGCWINVR